MNRTLKKDSGDFTFKMTGSGHESPFLFELRGRMRNRNINSSINLGYTITPGPM